MKAYHPLDDLSPTSAFSFKLQRFMVCCILAITAWMPGELWAQAPVVTNVEAINTAQSEYAPVYYGSDLVYVHQPINGRYDVASKQNYFELFRSPTTNDRRKKGKRFTIEPRATYHEGPVSFSKDGRQVFFTKTNTKGGVSQSASSGEAKLKIYYAYQGQYGWTGVQELPINDDERNTLHPSLSADGNRLFFTSDRIEDGFGGLDLYFSEWVDGKWTAPINMGPEVNTSADECYPFIHDSGQLFFASNREGGSGRMDLYSMDLSGRQWGKVYRLPPPYNTKYDDFGFILAADSKTGYLSSNRVGSKGKDDIYAFTAPQGMQSFIGNTVRKEAVSIYSAETSGRLTNARLFLYEQSAKESVEAPIRLQRLKEETYLLRTANTDFEPPLVRQFISGADGLAEIELKEGRSYRMLIQKAGYRPELIRFNYGPDGPSRALEVVLQSGECTLVSGRVISEENASPIGLAEVTFHPVDCSSQPVKATTDLDGSYFVCLPSNCNYQVVLQHPSFLEATSAFNAAAKVESFHEFNVAMTPQGVTVANGIATLSAQSTILLKDIQYTDDRFELSSQYQSELQLLSKLLTESPSMTILIENHTETNGPEVYHQEMSEKRVAEIKSYLVKSGVAPDRIKTVAHGSRVPLLNCKRPANCSASQHRSNRRTEIKILTR